MAAQNNAQTSPKTDTTTSTAKASKDPSHEQVHKLLEGYSTVMLVTLDGPSRHPTMNARPMAVAKLDEDCTITFLTKVDSDKVDEAKSRGASVTAQGTMSFLSIAGTTEVSRDKATIAAAWKPSYKSWFPEGLDDPTLCALVFKPSKAEIWDSTGTKGVSYLFEVAKAFITGTTPQVDPDQHKTVDMRVWKS